MTDVVGETQLSDQGFSNTLGSERKSTPQHPLHRNIRLQSAPRANLDMEISRHIEAGSMLAMIVHQSYHLVALIFYQLLAFTFLR